MRKLLFFLVLSMSLLFIAHAGYEIRGVRTNLVPEFKNYTLTTDGGGIPISAGSMSTLGSTTVKNAIVIVRSGSSGATIFNIALPFESVLGTNIEVRDFHYVTSTEKYVLCGSRGGNAFVAEIDNNFTTMRFVPYSEADVFHSILANFPSGIINPLGYYLCGASGNRGVICSINPTNMQFSNFYTTDIPWEYNKIITKRTGASSVRIVASGRAPAPGYTRLGFTVLNTLLGGMSSYMWAQNSAPTSHSVVADYVSDNTTVILASTYRNILYLYQIDLTSLPVISTTTFLLGPTYETFYIQDIGVNPFVHAMNARIAIAGYMSNGIISFQNQAWYGYLTGLSWGALTNQIYYDTSIGYLFQHYKIRYNQQGKEYTGGYFENSYEKCALFGSPINPSYCDPENPIYNPIGNLITCDPFTLSPYDYSNKNVYPFNRVPYTTDVYYLCDVLKGGAAPEFVMPSLETENEIITFHDHIAVKDVSMNTTYQIYSVTGQLIQAGITTPDISTAQLSRGMYILRLENGKAFKFVK